ncbi:hypothetical protein MC885_009155 [Smutsia gigantea]|nr:hypothetical protein MC885_009155 [Smutsia gigantea]
MDMENALASSETPAFSNKDSLGDEVLAAALLKAKSQMVRPELSMIEKFLKIQDHAGCYWEDSKRIFLRVLSTKNPMNKKSV